MRAETHEYKQNPYSAQSESCRSMKYEETHATDTLRIFLPVHEVLHQESVTPATTCPRPRHLRSI
jgi:hypothetical protein